MSTLVTFHAHPDDEAIATAGVMAKAAADGHRVVLVTATRGEHGEVVPGVLREGEPLAERRAAELERAAAVLGVARCEVLGYVDSGMMGTPENDRAGSFWRADLDEAAGRLAAILAEERADVLTVYDDHGTYGHPDHIQVHRVGVRAGKMAGVPKVYEATISRDHVRRLAAIRPPNVDEEELPPDPDAIGLGVPEGEITTIVDVTAYLDKKRQAMAVHASQIPESSFFLSLPVEAFAAAFGQEWFILRGATGDGVVERDLFEGLSA
ncbi:MAG TPA: PIG-L family deacetylase [Acidimicrobiales bacterium]|nr:PIG-L family deacetylase [Acidimicrobiales bacterium]